MDKRPILIIEDSVDDQDLIKEALKAANVQNPLLFEREAERAISLLLRPGIRPSQYPCLIMLDLLMPEKDGLDFLKKLRRTEATRRIPVIVLTQSQSLRDLHESYRLGANSFISKGGSLADFQAKIRCMCDYWLRICQLPVA